MRVKMVPAHYHIWGCWSNLWQNLFHTDEVRSTTIRFISVLTSPRWVLCACDHRWNTLVHLNLLERTWRREQHPQRHFFLWFPALMARPTQGRGNFQPAQELVVSKPPPPPEMEISIRTGLRKFQVDFWKLAVANPPSPLKIEISTQDWKTGKWVAQFWDW